ncbi:uncharacterized protein [Lepidochelys kempii]|uniref:uncharacterized protein n=1 Tax=Lepidochelys kempii TaxID=8472 RepID=UPI003C6FE6A7
MLPLRRAAFTMKCMPYLAMDTPLAPPQHPAGNCRRFLEEPIVETPAVDSEEEDDVARDSNHAASQELLQLCQSRANLARLADVPTHEGEVSLGHIASPSVRAASGGVHLRAVFSAASSSWEEQPSSCPVMAALLSCHLGYGTCMLVGEPPSGSQISFDPMLLFSGRQWKESLIGGWKLKDSLPKLVSDYMNKKFNPHFAF